MKKGFKVYLEQDTFDKLKSKAQQMGFKGRGGLSHFLEKIALESLCFLDDNLKLFLQQIKFGDISSPKV